MIADNPLQVICHLLDSFSVSCDGFSKKKKLIWALLLSKGNNVEISEE